MDSLGIYHLSFYAQKPQLEERMCYSTQYFIRQADEFTYLPSIIHIANGWPDVDIFTIRIDDPLKQISAPCAAFAQVFLSDVVDSVKYLEIFIAYRSFSNCSTTNFGEYNQHRFHIQCVGHFGKRNV